jgi:hypothetical protein
MCQHGRSDNASQRTTKTHTDLSEATSDFCPMLAELLQTHRAVGKDWPGLRRSFSSRMPLLI